MEIVVALVLTALLCLATIRSKADVSLRYVVSGEFWLFFLFLAFGNVLSTYAVMGIWQGRDQSHASPAPPASQSTESVPATNASTDPRPHGPLWLWAPFLGTLGFSAVLSRVSIGVLGKEAIPIEETRLVFEELAVAAAVKKAADAESENIYALVASLSKIPEATINAYVAQLLGEESVEELESVAKNSKAEPAQIKAQALAFDQYTSAVWIVRNFEKHGSAEPEIALEPREPA